MYFKKARCYNTLHYRSYVRCIYVCHSEYRHIRGPFDKNLWDKEDHVLTSKKLRAGPIDPALIFSLMLHLFINWSGYIEKPASL